MTGFKIPASPAASRTSPNGARSVAAGFPTRQRPRALLALGIALVIGFAALGYWAWSRAGSKVAVVAAARDIPIGHVITRADLTTTEVAGGITAVSTAHLDALIGKTAAVEILPDTLIQQAMVSTGTGLGATEAVVGVAVGPGQVPPTGLRPGDRAEVLGLPAQGTTSAATPTVLADGAVVVDEQANPATAGGVLVALQVPKPAAAGIAAASSAELVALVQVGG